MSEADAEDVALLAAWAAGGRAAGDALVRRHFDRVFRFFRSKLTRDVDDLVQRTFLACVESHSRYRAEGSFRAFLLGVARIQLLRYLQRELPRAPDPLELSALDIDVQTRRGSPSFEVAAREERDLVVAALQKLPIATQMCLELHYWEGMSIEEVAHVVGVPTGTVKTRMHRGRAMLRVELERVASDPAARAGALARVQAWLVDDRDDS